MSDDRTLTFYYMPQTRASMTLALLYELDVPFALHAMNIHLGEQRQPAYLAVNPMGKVPAIRHGEAVVTEQGAVMLYLADTFSPGRLAPALDDPLRGPYLRWMVFYGSSFEPAVVDKAMKRTPVPASTSPYSDYDTMIGTLTGQLRRGPWLLGERFTAADVLWGSALNWTVQFGVVDKTPEIAAYLDRWLARPAAGRTRAFDADMAAKMKAAAEGKAAPA